MSLYFSLVHRSRVFFFLLFPAHTDQTFICSSVREEHMVHVFRGAAAVFVPWVLQFPMTVSVEIQAQQEPLYSLQ